MALSIYNINIEWRKSMKKFITTISLQGNDLTPMHYNAMDNESLICNKKIAFPILATINNFVSKNEKIIIVPVIIKGKIDGEVSNKNYELFLAELEEMKKDIGFEYDLLPVYKNGDETVDTQIKLFSKLIGVVEKDDELFACLTYGTKPIPIIINMALNYAYKVKENVEIRKVVYGARPWNAPPGSDIGEIYDVTPLFYIDSAINSLAKLKLTNPEDALRAMLGVEG